MSVGEKPTEHEAIGDSDSNNEQATTRVADRDTAKAERKAAALFSGPVDFLLSVPTMAVLPPATLAEIAVVGRSNVGKSSLLNALTNRKNLARTSVTPGRTQSLNYFTVAVPPRFSLPNFYLVDMPGYGYAKASHTDIKAWQKLIRAYLCGRVTLKRVLMLVDSRHGLKESDMAMMTLLDEAAVSYQIILTKADKIKVDARQAVCDSTSAAIAKRPAAYPEVLVTSASKGYGIPALRTAVLSATE